MLLLGGEGIHIVVELAAALADEVVLLDDDGHPIGTHDRLSVHTGTTPLHLAFSAYLFDPAGRLLLTRRALTKATWPGIWTNSCCGHPRPGEPVVDAARRRIAEELGIVVDNLTPVLPEFRYLAQDASGVVENELCPVFVATVTDPQLRIDPLEVMDHAWVRWADLITTARVTPEVLSPWAVAQIAELVPLLTRVGRSPDRSPEPGETAARVEELIAADGEAMARLWHLSVPAVDVSGDGDLPAWLQGLLAGGGKRFRTQMAHWGFVGCGGQRGSSGYEELIRAVAALETLHLFALLHDDVMDDSTHRRGRPAAHRQAHTAHSECGGRGDGATFGRNMAILVGDLAHTRADRLAAGLSEPLRTAWFELSVELIAGQRADLSSAAVGAVAVEQAHRIADLKSGSYTVTRPLQLGALAAGASAEQWTTLTEFGTLVGRAFALRDDLLGVWGDPIRTGKPAGDDLSQGKPTVILALAQQRLTGEDAVVLARMATPLEQPGDVEHLQHKMAEAGVQAQVEQMITDAVGQAQRVLATADLSPAARVGLAAVAHDIAWRSS